MRVPDTDGFGETVLRQPRLETTRYFVLEGAGTHGKPGPVVVVQTPEAELEIRSIYPGETVTWVRAYRGESL